MKTRFNLFLAYGLLVTLAVAFSTVGYNRLTLNMIAGTAAIEVLFLAIGFALLRERNRHEDSLQEQLLFLQTLIDTIPTPIFYKDRAGRYLGYNLAFEESLGLTRDQLIGKTVYDVAPQDLADKYFTMDEALFSKPGVQAYESSVAYADGTLHEVIFNKATFAGKDSQVAGLVGVILDVTERKKAEDILAEREEFLTNIFDSIQDGISILDEELRLIRVNPVIERRFSDKMPIVGRKCHEAYHGRTEPCESCPTIKTLRSGKPFFKTFSMVENETECWLELYTYPLFDSKKSRIMGVVEYTRDVTERKRAEYALVFAEKQFRSLVEQSLVGAYIIQDSRFVYVNPKMAEIFGYTQDELTSGITHLDLTVEEDRPLAAENVRRRTVGEVQSVHYGFKGLRKDGATINAEVYGTGTQYNGRPAIIGTLLDVTARKRAEAALRESEERFHLVFAQNGDAIILVRMDSFAIIDANQAAEELTGYTMKELLELTPSSFIDHKDFRRLIDTIPIDGYSRSFQLDRATSTRKDGSTMFVAIRCKILRLRDEYIIHCSIRDITEKLHLEDEIRATQAKLIQTNKMTSLGMLSSSVAHEINNPNNCISVNASVLTEVWQDTEKILRHFHEENGEFNLRGVPYSKMQQMVPRLIHGIIEGSRRITAIVDNMKDFVREDKIGLHVELDINKLIRSAASILWHHIHKYTDNFQMVLQDDILPARGNGQQIEQVIINLLMNALQALPDKKCSVCIMTSCDRNAGEINITVRDEGEGMSKNVVAHLREPFFTTKLDQGGTGLGLYISDSIIKEHCGSLEFASKPGKGTVATIQLPSA
jgi:PAS domain S-box-containing protein